LPLSGCPPDRDHQAHRAATFAARVHPGVLDVDAPLGAQVITIRAMLLAVVIAADLIARSFGGASGHGRRNRMNYETARLCWM